VPAMSHKTFYSRLVRLSSSYVLPRYFSRHLQPQPEDLTPELSREVLSAYEEVKTRFETLSTKSVDGGLFAVCSTYAHALISKSSSFNHYRSNLIGGAKGIERHVVKNKKVLVRDRIKMLIDPETEFLELGQLVGYNLDYGDVPAGGIVTGS